MKGGNQRQNVVDWQKKVPHTCHHSKEEIHISTPSEYKLITIKLYDEMASGDPDMARNTDQIIFD